MAPCGFPMGGTGPGGLVHRRVMVSPRSWTCWCLEVVESPCLGDCRLTRTPVPLDYTRKQDPTTNGWRNGPPSCSWKPQILRQFLERTAQVNHSQYISKRRESDPASGAISYKQNSFSNLPHKGAHFCFLIE